MKFRNWANIRSWILQYFVNSSIKSISFQKRTSWNRPAERAREDDFQYFSLKNYYSYDNSFSHKLIFKHHLWTIKNGFIKRNHRTCSSSACDPNSSGDETSQSRIVQSQEYICNTGLHFEWTEMNNIVQVRKFRILLYNSKQLFCFKVDAHQ